MLSFIKNSLYYIVTICFAISCDGDAGVKTNLVVNANSKIQSTPTFTILQYGELPPPLYFNAVEIVGKHYNICFKDIAGCIVSERLVDSVNRYNASTYEALKGIYKCDMKNEIDNAVTAEYAYLNKMDSVLRKNAEIKKELTDELIYYSRKNKIYTANFIVTEPDYKVLTFKLTLVASVDSSTKQISGITKKDSLIKQFSDLQL